MRNPGRHHYEEIEIKLRVADAGLLRSRLRRIGARRILPPTFESNTLYDTPQNDLRRRGRLLRVRTERPARSAGNHQAGATSTAILTYKAPLPPAGRGNAGRKRRPGKLFKVREEAEVTVHGNGQMARILHGLGLRPVFLYQKVRTTYTLPGLRGLKIELDETPIGTYLELEGPVQGIKRAARLLGYGAGDYLTATYGALYLAECRRRRQKPGDMVFPQKKSR